MAFLANKAKPWEIFVMVIVILSLSLVTQGFAMEITSSSFKHGQFIPAVHTCDGRNISPQLSWSGAPEGTKSYALTCIDPDAPGGDFIHWLVYNIPAQVTGIPKGGPVPAGAKEVFNDFGKKTYGGPCPPSGTHRYLFTIYALRTEKLQNIHKNNFLKKIKKNQISSAQIMGLYKRR